MSDTHDGLYSFMAEDWHMIQGRGRAASFSADQIPTGMWDPRQLLGDEVLIDGLRYIVTGVDTYAIHRSVEHPYRLSFSLLVREP